MPRQNYSEAIGRTRRKTIWLDPASIDRMADLLDLPRGTMSGTVPVPWHWVYFFSESVANSRIGRDGHPARGDFLPAIRSITMQTMRATLSATPGLSCMAH